MQADALLSWLRHLKHLERSTGIAPVLPASTPPREHRARRGPRTGGPGYCSYTNSAWRAKRSAISRELFARAPQPRVAEPSYKWSEQRELNSRHRVGGPRHQPLYHARFNKHWRSQRELNRGPQHAPLLRVVGWLEPVPPDRQSGILPLDSATTFNLAARAGFEPA